MSKKRKARGGEQSGGQCRYIQCCDFVVQRNKSMAHFGRSRVLFSLLGLLLWCCTAHSQLRQPLDPNLARTSYTFRVHPGIPRFTFQVEVDKTSTITGVSVFREGARSPFQTLLACNKDLPMQLLEGDEQLALVTQADLNFDGYEDVKLLQYTNDHLGKKLFCVYIWS